MCIVRPYRALRLKSPMWSTCTILEESRVSGFPLLEGFCPLTYYPTPNDTWRALYKEVWVMMDRKQLAANWNTSEEQGRVESPKENLGVEYIWASRRNRRSRTLPQKSKHYRYADVEVEFRVSSGVREMCTVNLPHDGKCLEDKRSDRTTSIVNEWVIHTKEMVAKLRNSRLNSGCGEVQLDISSSFLLLTISILVSTLNETCTW